MKQEIAKIWIDALRSGEYTQGRGALKFSRICGGFKHCCLGVLCELYDKNNEKQLDKFEDEGGNIFFNNTDDVLPEAVMEWSGLVTNVGTLPDNNALADINDLGVSFQEIADIIEQNVGEL